MIINLFGQPGSGKTTLANFITQRQIEAHEYEFNKLISKTNSFTHLDGDILRNIFKDANYSPIGRRRNIQRAMDIALYIEKTKEASDNTPILSLISPYREQRLWLHEQTTVAEIYLYHNARERPKGEFHVTDFQPPHLQDNYLAINTSEFGLFECYYKIRDYALMIKNNS